MVAARDGVRLATDVYRPAKDGVAVDGAFPVILEAAVLLALLNHDNIVKVFSLTTIADQTAILMEYVEGIDCNLLVDAPDTLQQAAQQGLPVHGWRGLRQQTRDVQN